MMRIQTQIHSRGARWVFTNSRRAALLVTLSSLVVLLPSRCKREGIRWLSLSLSADVCRDYSSMRIITADVKLLR